MNNYADRHYSSILPITFGALPAALVTALLISLMHSLIASDVIPIDDEPVVIAELVRPDPELPVIIKENPLVRPVNPIFPPRQQVTRSTISLEDSDLTWFDETVLPPGDTGIEIGVGGGGVDATPKPQLFAEF